ncbi:hypothetical protein EU244_028530 [Rhodococcus qingshengii]|uniref:hypothetical protein n=1 Tax=Rhodococcus qingshengii TaxID=334542 RepID=UPI0027D267A2|nr:hypothetical protein [Rhodococcus qingshengii]
MAPKALGGDELGVVGGVIVVEEIARECPALALGTCAYRNQCGVQSPVPAPCLRSADPLSRTVVSRNAASKGGRTTFTSSGLCSSSVIPNSVALPSI